jgi:enterochelin esterase-like enzyme
MTLWILIGQALVGPADTTNQAKFENWSESSFFSQSRNREIRFAIYVPPGYESGDERYPVLYFLHGRGVGYLLYWGAIQGRVAHGDPGAWFNQLIADEVIPPVIIVTPDDEEGGWGAENETMVTEELIAHIDQNWRTIANRSGRAIEGFSMGGMGANRYGARHPDLYCSTIIMAAPDVSPLELDWQENKEAILENELDVRLAVGGEDDQVVPMTALDSALTTLGIPHEFEIVPGVPHDFGTLYNEVGIEGLQFHAACFERNRTPVDEEDPLPEKIFMPFLNRHLRDRIAFE